MTVFTHKLGTRWSKLSRIKLGGRPSAAWTPPTTAIKATVRNRPQLTAQPQIRRLM